MPESSMISPPPDPRNPATGLAETLDWIDADLEGTIGCSGMRTLDILMRTVAAIVALGCGVYFVFGLAVAAAAYQPGTAIPAIHHDEPVTFPMLWHEASKVSFSAVVRWLRTDGCGV